MHRISRAVRVISGIALASALCAPAASAEEKSTKPRIAVLEFKNQAGGAASAPLEVLGFAWGDASAYELEPAFIKSWSTSGDADAPAHRGGGSNQMTMDDTAGKKTAAPAAVSHDLRTNVVARTAPPPGSGGDPDRPLVAGSVPNASSPSVGADETITIGGARTETASGQATGKRQHMPVRVRTYYDQPQSKGSVWIRVATPWAACRVGARYPSLRLAEGARAYTLEDVTVASCGDADDRPTEEVAFYYNKVTVRGWDPKKKEE